MLRTISTLMALGAITAACSGGGAGTVDARDGTPPVVTLSAPSLTIEGGETAAITLTANDETDGALTGTITCNGGTVAGNLLVTSPVTADTSITCTGTATDKAGNRGTGTITFTIKATVASLAPAADRITLAQGQIGVLFAQDLPLDQASYQGDIDGQAITLTPATASGLAYAIPEGLAPGTHRLSVTVGGHRYSYEITVTAAPAIADPKAVVRSVLTDMRTQMDALLASDGATMTAAQKAKVTEYRDGLAEGLAQIDTISAASLKTLALHFQVNGVYNAGGQGAAGYSDAECDAAQLQFVANVIDTVAYVGIAAVALSVPEPVVTKIFGVVMGAKGLRSLARTVGSVGSLLDKCIDTSKFSLESSESSGSSLGNKALFVRATAAEERYGFRNKKARSFRVAHELMMEPSRAAKARLTMQRFTDALAKLPYVPDEVTAAVGSFYTEKTEYVPAAQVSLGGISDGRISGSKGGSGDTITLTFRAAPDVTVEAIDFSFSLGIPGESPITLPARLSLSLPDAQDAAVTLIQGRAVQSNVQVTAAESIEILDAPDHGNATISPEGLLSYTPSGLYFGADSLKYRAVNGDGYSRTATVLFTIDRQFDGLWSIHSVSTTTSQSQAGLCPNEDNNLQVFVSKVSDTLYTATFDGVTLNLTMASKDDPAGLKGNISGTYDDGPGETTETLTVSVPDSNRIFGTSFWNYVGPGNTRCGGNTQITGTRP